jgi:hypothetical protein
MIVLETMHPVIEQARHVSICDDAIGRWAEGVSEEELTPPAHDLLAHLPGSQDQLANLVLLIDSLNFCFWSDDPIRFEWRGKTYERFNAMLVSLMLAAKYEPMWCQAEYWVDVPGAEIREVLSGTGELLLLDERERIVRETGRVLLERFDGQFTNAIDSVNEKAWPLAVLLMTNFDSFRDVSNYHGKAVYFLKRAQICALDVSIAFETHGLPPLQGLEELAAFADYRLPQSLRHLGILELAPRFAEAIEEQREVPRDSDEEVEMRAATIEAVERMRRKLEAIGKPAPAWRIDWYLWVFSHRDEVTVNHHRTRTVCY